MKEDTSKRHLSEDRLQADCFTWFHNAFPNLRGCLFHVPNEGKRTNGNKLKAMGLISGIPDLVLAVNGFVYGIELKTSSGTQSEDQRKIERQWTDNNNPYTVLRSEDEFRGYVLKVLQENNK